MILTETHTVDRQTPSGGLFLYYIKFENLTKGLMTLNWLGFERPKYKVRQSDPKYITK